VTLTLVGEAFAKPGVEFTYVGTQPECAGCRLKTVCHDLAANRPYRVAKVRDVHHECPAGFFEGGMRLVEVEPVTPRGVIPESALKGVGITQRFEECGAICLYKRFCRPAAVPEGTMCTIESVGEKVECKVGRELRFARLKPA